MPRKKFIAGNWKMYTSLTQAKELAAAVCKGVASDSVTVAICPPFPWLTTVGEVLKGTRVGLGAQDCGFEKEGAFTGQVSPPMLLDAGCRYVIIGHSERRHGLNESDELLNKKAKAALAAGLEVIFCIGELLLEREGNRTESVLERQLKAGLMGISLAQMEKLVIAYEPVWAIGTGKVATEQQAQDAHAFVRKTVGSLYGQATADALIIQYGGSVKPENAAGLMAQPDVDGALVGGASLKADSFLGIIKGAM
ncbi:MAG TPA: triose-phosphate isomerase [Gemmata sp.]|nr:triose-phosphate isomerase [Gemmata sp.]